MNRDYARGLLLLTALCLLGVSAGPSGASAQDSGHKVPAAQSGKKSSKTHKAPHDKHKSKKSAAASAAPSTQSTKDDKASAAGPSAAPASASPLAVDDAADVKKEGGTEVKVMEFNGLDIEGQLKTPQMLYFLNRLRAEFGRPRLPHRSFMPELQTSTKEREF